MTQPDPTSVNPTQMLAEEFRRRLEIFYAGLKLAPPYESVEKAIRTLTSAVHALPKAEQEKIAGDPALQWQHFGLAFQKSSLTKKHRGIIAGLARKRSTLDLPAEYNHFLNLFNAQRPRIQDET
jgi:hypothetical protein